MNKALFTLALLSGASPALADAVNVKPIVDARLRYEGVEQGGRPRDADALTLRLRTGAEAKTNDFTLLVEAEGTYAVSEKFNSTTNGKTAFPVVADPENIELNRIQLQYSGIKKTLVTVGRQRINLDDQRFVGSVGFRQNEQTFDAARIEFGGIKNVKADIIYASSVRTIFGIDGIGARPTRIDGDNVFANLAYKTKYGTLTGFAYLVDQDELAVQGFRFSSQTYGGRFAGAKPLSKVAKLTYLASYARQSDYNRNPNNYSADYVAAELGVEAKGLKLLGGYELLGSSSGLAFTSLQTPLATLHKFNGAADLFLTTPPNGLQDLYGTIGYTKLKVGPFDSIGVLATYHDYKSDRLSLNYGDEINLQVVAKLKKYTFTLKYADYNARSFATDTKKLFASVEWAF
jgi:Alginate export